MATHNPSSSSFSFEEVDRINDSYKMQATGDDHGTENIVASSSDHIDVVDDLTEEQMGEMTFNVVDDAELSYLMYARAMGFGIRKSDKKYDVDGNLRYRKWVCCREGERDDKWNTMENRTREAKSVTRVNCGACFQIKMQRETNKYVVMKFVREHSHPMATPSTIGFLHAHRSISDADYRHARTLQRVGTKTSQIMKLFALENGGYDRIMFQAKDLYNKMQKHNNKDIVGGDAKGALGYLQAKKDLDNQFYYNYCTDSEGRLSRLFWADSQCVYDYNSFGDVLVFDSTYKTNSYNQPLVVLCGVNNHFSTCIFGCCLVANEDESSYDWGLLSLLEANRGKKPESVLTDGDPAMKRAIENILPETTHRLCSWHIARNAQQNLSKEIAEHFSKCMHSNWSPQKFEKKWQEFVSQCGVEANKWVMSMYAKKEKWAKAYLWNFFFVGMSSTQRCEKMNDVLKINLKPKLKLFEFLRAFDLGMSAVRHEEKRLIVETEQTSLIPITDMPWIEEHAAKIYTRRMYLKVRDEIKAQGIYNRYDCMDQDSQKIHFIENLREKRKFLVQHVVDTGMLGCSCMMFEVEGIPCTHMFRVMLLERIDKIPQGLIKERWSRYARRGGEREQHVADESSEFSRHGRLMVAYREMCYYASKIDVGFQTTLAVVVNETSKLKGLFKDEFHHVDSPLAPCPKYGVKDPIRARTKGSRVESTKKKKPTKHCGNCGKNDGHNRRTCPLKASFTNDNPYAFEGTNCNRDTKFASEQFHRTGLVNGRSFGESMTTDFQGTNNTSSMQAPIWSSQVSNTLEMSVEGDDGFTDPPSQSFLN